MEMLKTFTLAVPFLCVVFATNYSDDLGLHLELVSGKGMKNPSEVIETKVEDRRDCFSTRAQALLQLDCPSCVA